MSEQTGPDDPFGGPSYIPPPPAGTPPGGMPHSWGAPPGPAGTAAGSPVLLLQAVGIAVVGAIAWGLLLDFANLQLSVIAVLVGSLTGSLLARGLGKGPVAATIAALLTAVACVVGQVGGVWARAVRETPYSLSEIRSALPISRVLHYFGAISWLFVVAGVVFAVLAGIGRYDRFGQNRGGFSRRRF